MVFLKYYCEFQILSPSSMGTVATEPLIFLFHFPIPIPVYTLAVSRCFFLPLCEQAVAQLRSWVDRGVLTEEKLKRTLNVIQTSSF